MLKKILNSIRPSGLPRTRQSDSAKQYMDETDAALDRLKARRKLPTIPDVHVHLPPQQPSKAPGWVKLAAALGIPAILLEIIRRYLP